MTGARNGTSTATAVAALHLARTPSDETMALSYQPPWACAVEAFPGAGTPAAVVALTGNAKPDTTVLIESRTGTQAAEVAAAANEVRKRLPAAEVLLFDPRSVLRFLWCYRDGQDPMALARAADRVLFDENYFARPVPEIRSGRRADRRRAIVEVRRLLRSSGSALGIDLPFPWGEREERSWGLSRTCGLVETGLGLYAGLLRRWGSPLAVVRKEASGVGRVALMDRWLRECES